MIRKYSPATLRDSNFVEIVDLRRIDADRVSQYMESARNVTGVRCDDQTALTIVTAWRSLAPGEPDRCHTPPIGFRFFVNDEVYLEASVCWLCNNIYGVENGTELFFAFDSKSEAAKELLILGKRVVGDEVVGEG